VSEQQCIKSLGGVPSELLTAECASRPCLLHTWKVGCCWLPQRHAILPGLLLLPSSLVPQLPASFPYAFHGAMLSAAGNPL
jgi:hypothetical protein